MPRILVVDTDLNRLSQVSSVLAQCENMEFYPALDCDEALYAIEATSGSFDVLVFSESLGADEFMRLHSMTPWLKRIKKLILLVAIGGEPEVVRFYNMINEQGGEVVGFIRDFGMLEELGSLIRKRYSA